VPLRFAWVAEKLCALWPRSRAHRRRRRIAGGNLALAVAVASAYERPEPWAREVFDCGVRPAAVAPLMPYLQVSNPTATGAQSAGSWLAVRRAEDIAQSYLGVGRVAGNGGNADGRSIRSSESRGQPARRCRRCFPASHRRPVL